MDQNNPAARQGWVASKDPSTGRTFYANHVTRQTQWEPPPGWVESPPPTPAAPAAPPMAPQAFASAPAAAVSANRNNSDGILPSNWEVMHDQRTGKPFYVDHERKITQWTRPETVEELAAKQQAALSSQPASLQPARAAATNNRNSSAAMQRIQATARRSSSYQQPEYSYYSQPVLRNNVDVDFSDAMPVLDFSVKKVADALRPACPHCGTEFTYRLRRHHCRLCGDVFCDACSTGRATLPLPGPEFEKPVRVCDFCCTDVNKGNFFSMRRYLTPLHLYDKKSHGTGINYDSDDEDGGVATVANVNAALSAAAQDLEQMVNNLESNALQEKVTIPAVVFMPAVLKHLKLLETSDRAVKCIASILALENICTSDPEQVPEFAVACYVTGQRAFFDDLYAVLERNGNDRKTLYIQEQATRVLFYLTEPKTIVQVMRKIANLQSGSIADYYNNEEQDRTDANHSNINLESASVEQSLDIANGLRCMLDHSSSSKNPNLQRWSAACIKNLVLEDQRRATMAINDLAAMIAAGEAQSAELSYTSTLDTLVSEGGIMILCTLIGADDNDTRAHAVASVSTILQSRRAIDASLSALYELSGGAAGAEHPEEDAAIVRAIVAGGACSQTVSQLLLSAEHDVAGMGCAFLASLVMPLLQDPTGAAGLLASNYDWREDNTCQGACREAAVEICTGSCLPALLSLLRQNGSRQRPIDLRKTAAETLAAVVKSVGDMGKAWAGGTYEAGMEEAPAKLRQALVLLQEEGCLEVAVTILSQSNTSGQSLGIASSKETPNARIREAAGIMLSALTSCSAEAIMELQQQQSNHVLSSLLTASNDASTTLPSTLLGDGSPRCLGALETVSAVLMFAWQHPAGASSELLDRLIEVMDAGAIPYCSRVLNAKLDWDAGKTASGGGEHNAASAANQCVGGFKGRAAACRLLSCLAGIALTDDTGIGMRRFMDAVAQDARQYRGTSNGGRGPNNLIESALQTLQMASAYARRSLQGSLAQGPHYTAALYDLVDGALLAAGSMCGSSIAPGGSEGALITGDSFLTSTKRNDDYNQRRKEICNVSCDVVVRGSAKQQGAALLPTMLVGGFGEGAVLSSLRLALAICQNGTAEQHSKLAASGLLVPISDTLRTALSTGDLYKFSAALALVRFCGPHVVAGGGTDSLESVRAAIAVACAVLTLPVNVSAPIQHLETQEALKSECISALESLSRNAALWSCISTDALPSIVQYLHSSTTIGQSAGSAVMAKYQGTCLAALRAVMQIVQVPSHAVAAAQSGIVDPLSKLLKLSSISTNSSNGDKKKPDIPMMALNVLHVIACNPQARKEAKFLDSGMVRAVCAAVGKSAADRSVTATDTRSDVTFLGLEILHAILLDVSGRGASSTQEVLQSAAAVAFLDAVASEHAFLRAMCATLLLKTNMKIPLHSAEGDSMEETLDIPDLYGSPLLLVKEKCCGGLYANTDEAAASVFFTVSVFACAIDSQRSEAFWKTVLLQDAPSNTEPTSSTKLSAAFSAHVLQLLTADYKPFVPADPKKKKEYTALARPLVRHRLLEALRDSIQDLSSQHEQPVYGMQNTKEDSFVISMLIFFNVPHICLDLWKDPALLDLAFDIMKQIFEHDIEEVLHLFVETKAAVQSLLDLLNVNESSSLAMNSNNNVADIRRFLAQVLGQLAETGMLRAAVEKFGVRSSAIAALASACLNEQEEQQQPVGRHDDDENEQDMTSTQLSSVLMKCLVELCTVTDGKGGNSTIEKPLKRRIQLSEAEAESIANNLGRKICQMVLTRFLERAKLEEYQMLDNDDDSDDDIMKAPDVAMLCATAQHDKALAILRQIGGLHALSLVAAEGHTEAIQALQKACTVDATVLLEGDTYQSIMNLLANKSDNSRTSDQATRQKLELAALQLLAQLCSDSRKGRNAVAMAENCKDCIDKSIEIVSQLIAFSAEDSVEENDELKEDKLLKDDSGNNSTEESEELEAQVETMTLQVQPVIQKEPKVAENLTPEDANLAAAAYKFLAAVAPVKVPRDLLLENDRFLKASEFLAKSPCMLSPELGYAALTLLASLAQFASDDATGLAMDRLCNVFLAVFSSNLKIAPTADLNSNLMIKTAASGSMIIFDCLSCEKQNAIAIQAARMLGVVLKNFTVVRTTTRERERVWSAELCFNLTMLLLLARGKEFVDCVFTQELLVEFVHLLQWRFDPKTVLGSTIDQASLDAAVSNVLIMLSTIVWRPDCVLTKAGIDLKVLGKTVLMLARPGKAPRKAIDAKAALLAAAAAGQDSAASLASKRVMDRLY